jgi:hypothetical protein
MVFIFVTESPLWMIKAGYTERGKAALRKITAFNKIDADYEIETIDHYQT